MAQNWVGMHDISQADPFRVFGGVLNIPGRGWAFLPEKGWILDILDPNFEMAQNGIIRSSPEAYRIFFSDKSLKCYSLTLKLVKMGCRQAPFKIDRKNVTFLRIC